LAVSGWIVVQPSIERTTTAARNCLRKVFIEKPRALPAFDQW
jgi:hypothetical protein